MKLKQMMRSLWVRQPALGTVNLGDLAQNKPISSDFGFDRGSPIDRCYIEDFLTKYAHDIRGHVLEIKEPIYTQKFGGSRVTRSDVLHAVAGNPKATIVADLTKADQMQPNVFDCIILTQTLQFIYNVPAAIQTLHRILKPGGVLLITVPGISQISREDMECWGQYWSFTTLSMQKLLEEVFDSNNVRVTAYGNVLSAIALLHGLATEELELSKLHYLDLDYQVLISARAVKE
jgi:SAM-dependent methyltransferase